MNERLIKINANIIDWLKFAEAKNLLLLTFCGTLYKVNHTCVGFNSFLIIPFFLLLLSFYPLRHTDIKRMNKLLRVKNPGNSSLNILHPASIIYYNFETFKDEIEEIVKIDSYSLSKLDIMYIEDIYHNAMKANYKYRVFKIAFLFVFIYLIIMVLNNEIFFQCKV